MGENPETDILASPEHSILEFGDGFLATLASGVESVDEKGQIIVDMVILPEDLLKKRYNLPDSDLNSSGWMHFKVNKIDLVPLNVFDSAKRKWLYLKTFDKQETAISRLSKDLREEIKFLGNELSRQEGDVIFLIEQLDLARNNPAEFMNQGMEMVERAVSISRQLNNRGATDGTGQ